MQVRIEFLQSAMVTVLLCMACLPLVALAQPAEPGRPPRWPTQEDMEQARKARPFPDAGQIGRQAMPQVPRLDSKVQPVDIGELARQGLGLGKKAADTQGEPALRIFITLEMPKASLALLTDQAARTGAQLVLRGLKSQSMQKTLQAAGELIGEKPVSWVIDPEAFTRYGVNKAPTFVLTLEDRAPAQPEGTCGAGCVAVPPSLSVAGDVSLQFALESIQRRRPDSSSRVEPLLKRLRAPRS